jgi:hypothetical protein
LIVGIEFILLSILALNDVAFPNPLIVDELISPFAVILFATNMLDADT